MVPEDIEPSEEGANYSVIAKDDNVTPVNTAVSSTVVSPEPIPIPAPVRACMCYQQAIKGRGTKEQPYELDFTPTTHRSCVVPSRACSTGRSG